VLHVLDGQHAARVERELDVAKELGVRSHLNAPSGTFHGRHAAT
jgi:hypothetical protein